ncbi:MAG: Cna B-type domain-containing protein, partial [Lachnospiraceae bacterium]|nr:Cna B-type domain-containing protein [Lachnospiraceae bacterium]
VDLNVGVIKDRGLAFDTISLVTEEAKSGMIKYNDENKQTILDAINYPEASLKALSSGTNMHGGLVMADRWLTEDSTVEDDHKYVFFLTDGKTYIWNDENDIPTSVYGQYMASGKVYGTPAIGQQTIAYSKSAYKFSDNINFFKGTDEDLANLSFDEYFAKTGNFYANDFAKLYASTNEELSGKTKYDYRCGYAYKESASASGTMTEHAVSNGNGYTYALHKKYYEFVPSAAFADLNWLQANPYTVEENDGVYTYTTTVNPYFYQLHPDGLQKALYLTAHLWTDMVEKYNGAVINYNGWGSGSGLEIAKSFNEWIKSEGISDYAADIADAASVSAIFNSVKEDILYMVSEGVVTDQITDDFILKNDDNKDGFRMTLSGEALAVTFTDGKWYFGEADTNGVYPYVVEYDKENKTITWTLNVPVENANPITLSYDLILEDENAESGIYPTNVSAVLDYTSTDGQHDGSFEFEIPEVTYVRLIDVTVEKVWEDDDDEEGMRPGEVIVNLLCDGKAADEGTLNAAGNWQYTFTDLPEARFEDGKPVMYEYTVEELEVENYDCEIGGSAEDGFVITNTFTYTPPETGDYGMLAVYAAIAAAAILLFGAAVL